MRCYDVTRPIHTGMRVYPGDPEVAIEPISRVADGAPASVSAVRLGSHTGTHVDAPRHFFEGAPGADALPLDALIGPARLYALGGGGAIDVASLDGLDLGSCPRALFALRPPTMGEAGGFTAAAARLLVRAGVRLVGLEGMSADPASSADFSAHRILLEAGVIIVEGLDLSAVPPGRYELICLPLKLRGGDGAPARVVLRAAG